MVGSFQDVVGVHAAIAIPAQLFSSSAASLSAQDLMTVPLQ